MKYITGVFSLNLQCPSLDTPGDWHQSGIDWNKIDIRESSQSRFGNYGIYPAMPLPVDKNNTIPVANHIRACLDLIDQGRFPCVQGMRDDYICNEKYTHEIFERIYEMKNHILWEKIDEFMNKEYRLDWINFLKKKTNGLD